MNDQSKNQLINRILSGLIIIDGYILRPPTFEIKYRADLYYQEIYDEFKYDGIPLRSTLIVYLVNNGFMDVDYETKIKNMRDTIDRFKEELYLSKPAEEKDIRKRLKMIKDKYDKYTYEVESLLQNSLEGLCNYYKNLYILINTLYKDEVLAFNSKDIENAEFIDIISKIKNNEISLSSFREIARTDPWRGYWNLYKHAAFEFKHLSEEQKILSSFSRMYDNAFESPECPSDEILEDDDKFDGWLVNQFNKRKEEKQEKVKQDVLGKAAYAQELFLPAKNQEEANKIYSMNDSHGKKVLEQRAKVLKSKEKVKDLEFLDKKMELNRKFVSTIQK